MSETPKNAPAALKHTPGPWTILGRATISNEGNEEGVDEIVADDGALTVAYVTGQEVADARLIAAAPEMLEALAIIVANAVVQPDASMGGMTDTYAVPLDDIEAARALLSKITGGAK